MKQFLQKKIILIFLSFFMVWTNMFVFSGCNICKYLFKHQYSQKLIKAIEDDNMDELARLIQEGGNINAWPYPITSMDVASRPPLVVAAMHGNFKAVKMLVEAGAAVDVVSHDAQHSTPLYQAVIGAAGAAGRWERYDRKPYYDIAYYLIENGADIHYKNKYMGTAMCEFFAYYGQFGGDAYGFDFSLYLMEKGARLEDGAHGHILFSVCSNDNNLDIVKYIFNNYEIDISMRSKAKMFKDYSLLMCAAKFQSAPEICAFLLEKGVDKTLQGDDGKTAYDLALESSAQALKYKTEKPDYYEQWYPNAIENAEKTIQLLQ